MNLLALMYGLIAVAELAAILWVSHRLMYERTVNRLIAASHSSTLDRPPQPHAGGLIIRSLPEQIEPRVVYRDRKPNYEIALYGVRGEIDAPGYHRKQVFLVPNVTQTVSWEEMSDWGKLVGYRGFPLEKGWPDTGTSLNYPHAKYVYPCTIELAITLEVRREYPAWKWEFYASGVTE